jgi:hypothetical protein
MNEPPVEVIAPKRVLRRLMSNLDADIGESECYSLGPVHHPGKVSRPILESGSNATKGLVYLHRINVRAALTKLLCEARPSVHQRTKE